LRRLLWSLTAFGFLLHRPPVHLELTVFDPPTDSLLIKNIPISDRCGYVAHLASFFELLQLRMKKAWLDLCGLALSILRGLVNVTILLLW